MSETSEDTLSEDEIAELERLEKAATKGWVLDKASVLFGPNDDGTGIAFDVPADAELIVAMRDALLRLLRQVRRERERRAGEEKAQRTEQEVWLLKWSLQATRECYGLERRNQLADLYDRLDLFAPAPPVARGGGGE